MEFLRSDLTEWTIGPFHSALPGAMRLRLELDGEQIVGVETETGFLHRGLEKAFELQPWRALLPYADRIAPDIAFTGEMVLCLAQESLLGIVAPPRAQGIRVVLSELSRIAAMLSAIAALARAVGSTATVHYLYRDRERILDLLELLTGSRSCFHFLRVGGVKQDLTDGFVERVLDICDLFRFRMKEYNDLFIYNRTLRERIKGVGVLSEKQARKWSLSGPLARASGLDNDVRVEQPYSGYEHLRMSTQHPHRFGDVFSRLLWWQHEMSQSLNLLRQMVESLKSGPFRESGVRDGAVPPQGESYVRIESPRGEFGCHMVSEGQKTPARIQLRTPSAFALVALPEALFGARIEDMPVILASLDLSLAEVDK